MRGSLVVGSWGADVRGTVGDPRNIDENTDLVWGGGATASDWFFTGGAASRVVVEASRCQHFRFFSRS